MVIGQPPCLPRAEDDVIHDWLGQIWVKSESELIIAHHETVLNNVTVSSVMSEIIPDCPAQVKDNHNKEWSWDCSVSIVHALHLPPPMTWPPAFYCWGWRGKYWHGPLRLHSDNRWISWYVGWKQRGTRTGHSRCLFTQPLFFLTIWTKSYLHPPILNEVCRWCLYVFSSWCALLYRH